MKVKEAVAEDPRKFELDPWQERVLRHQGDIVLRTGRGVGKTTAVSLKARKLAFDYPGSTTLVIAAAQRQSSLLFEAIRSMIERDNRELLEKKMKGKSFPTLAKKREWEKDHSLFIDDPTMTRLQLKNGSIIYCLPTGKTGAYIRGFVADFLIADEAVRIPDAVFVAVEPMLLIRKKAKKTGWRIILSTPLGREGYFYECCNDPDFLHIHVSAEKCSRHSKKELAKKKKRLTELQYAQEYLGEFIESYRRYFKDHILKKNVKINSWGISEKKNFLHYYLGVDVARFGKDSNAFVVGEVDKKKVRIVHAEISSRKDLIDTAGRIMALDLQFNFHKILIDATGVGSGLVDILKEKHLRRKIVETHALSRKIDEKKTEKTAKEDMYSNARILLEQGNCELLNHRELLKSLRSISFDYNSSGGLKLFGNEDHLCEAFVRACWGIKDYKRFFVM